MGCKSENLIEKYNVAAPRYTSYPTVPCWDQQTFSQASWKRTVQQRFAEDASPGISLYIHLPFCESLCTYCGCNTRITRNHSVEEPYIQALVKEWQMYRSLLGGVLHIREIHLGGGTPTFFTPKNLHDLITQVLEGNTCVPNPSFSFEAHPANTTAEHLQVLYDLGFRRLSLGIQDFDQAVQRAINRKQTVADVAHVMEQARSIGYTSINFDLIYGLPLQTQTSVAYTLDLSLAMKPERISFYSYAHVPWMKPGQRHFTEMDLPVGEAKMALYKLGRSRIKDAGYTEVGMDHYALPGDTLLHAADTGTLHRNFMGYTDSYSPLLIGLGVSAISDAWSAFAQNVKTLEAYYKLIDQGELPIFRGHILSAEDQRSRRYILEIMCRERVLLADVDTKKHKEIIARLRPMAEDGLVTMEGNEVKVTNLGKAFIRNICTAFDGYLHGKQQFDNQRFSQAV